MKSNDAYDQLCNDIFGRTNASSRANGRTSSAVSKSDLENMAVTFLNTPDHEVMNYSFGAKDTSGTGEPVGVTKKPAARYRNSLKPMLRKLGLDKHDVDSVDTIPIDREHASAMMEAATTVLHDYMRCGRKFAFPIQEGDETRMEMMIQRAPERTSVGNRFHKEGDSDSVTVTKERSILKTKNPVPYWLKSTKEK